MSIRKIVVPLIGAGSDAKALATGFQIAKAEGAHVDGVYLRPDPADAVPYVGDAASAAIIEDLYEATKAAADAASALAKAALERTAAKAGVPLVTEIGSGPRPSARFIDKMGSVAKVVIAKARLADLVVCAEVNANPPILAAFEAALIGARRPVLIAPKAEGTPIGTCAVIAWNGSTEAAQAVSNALPFLKKAQRVTVLAGDSEDMEPAPAKALCAYLGLHGIASEAESFQTKGKPVGAAILDRAEALKADLIVMGGYGHSRLREFILGGVTRHMLQNAGMAILLAH
jgi:nucleotide-binding universal stress UspA family protein